MKKLKSLFISMAVLFLFSCGSGPVSGELTGSLENIKRAGILKVEFRDRTIPALPLIDAGIYKEAYNNNIETYKAIEKAAASKVQDIVITRFSETSNISLNIVEGSATEENTDEDVNTSRINEYKKIMSEQGLEALVVVDVFCNMTGVSMLGASGGIFIQFDIKMYAPDGSILLQGEIEGDTSLSGPGQTEKYEEVLEEFYPMIDTLFETIFS